MFYISLYMKPEKTEGGNGENKVIHLCEDDFSYFCALQSVFDKADNIKLVESKELMGGGGMKGTGVSDLTYETESGIRLYLGIDGGFPIPEACITDFCCGEYTDKLAEELCVAFSKEYGKNFSRYELEIGKAPYLALYED